MFYAQECYDYGYFNECEKICSTLKQKPLNDVQNGHINILLTKSVFKLYLRESRIYSSYKEHFMPQELRSWEESKYQKAKRVVTCLVREDLYQIDKELAMFLDISMMECVQGKNRLHEVGHCMLCLRHCSKLIRSHIIPRSILEIFRRSMERHKGNKIFQISTDPMKYFTDKTLTRNLLCKNCEALLSVSGEQDFCEKFFKQIYNSLEPECLSLSYELYYGEWLYHFFIGFIFRGIAAFIGIPNIVNDEEFYDLFGICRKFLLKQNLSPLEALPDLHMFINPTSPPTEFGLQWNHATLVEPATFHAAYNQLLDENVSHCPKVHFFLAKIGIINVVVKLSPTLGTELSITSVIDPSGGTFKIPADKERLFLLPPGVKEMYTVRSQQDRKKFQDSLFRKDKFAPVPDTLKKDFDVQYRSSFRLRKAIDIDKLEFQQKIEKEGGLFLNCLPSHFKLDQKTGEVQFPFPFVKLLHYHMEPSDLNFAITLFIGFSSETVEPFIVYYEAMPDQRLSFGYTFNLEDCGVNEYISELALQDYPEPVAERIQEISKNLIPHLIPIAVERCGFISMKSLMYHFKYK